MWEFTELKTATKVSVPCSWYRKVKLVLQIDFRKHKAMRLHYSFPCNLRSTLHRPPPLPAPLKLHLFIGCLGGWLRCVWVWMWVPWGPCGDQRTTWESWLSPSMIWIPKIELKSAALAVSPLTHWAIPPALLLTDRFLKHFHMTGRYAESVYEGNCQLQAAVYGHEGILWS